MAGPTAIVNVLNFDGNGAVTSAVGSSSQNGSIGQLTETGTYTVNPDCTGTYQALNGVQLTGLATLNTGVSPAQTAATSEVPDWALPSGPNHKQYPPPPDFHRPTKTFDTPIGLGPPP